MDPILQSLNGKQITPSIFKDQIEAAEQRADDSFFNSMKYIVLKDMCTQIEKGESVLVYRL